MPTFKIKRPLKLGTIIATTIIICWVVLTWSKRIKLLIKKKSLDLYHDFLGWAILLTNQIRIQCAPQYSAEEENMTRVMLRLDVNAFLVLTLTLLQKSRNKERKLVVPNLRQVQRCTTTCWRGAEEERKVGQQNRKSGRRTSDEEKKKRFLLPKFRRKIGFSASYWVGIEKSSTFYTKKKQWGAPLWQQRVTTIVPVFHPVQVWFSFSDHDTLVLESSSEQDPPLTEHAPSPSSTSLRMP